MSRDLHGNNPKIFLHECYELTENVLCQQFDKDVDSCSKPEHKPVFEVKVKTGSLWPVVMIEKVRIMT